ncbi:uncharacterized protein LOC131427681 [Malaya genurostris]|uniref:uncharacterized protein LOC131427681 n=1 Tax=Malaya genurostris TaxID=325434 RepID=UPI0026F3FD69|nr:uncharacterized protein LOC131427681 [Malaya genurostris]
MLLQFMDCIAFWVLSILSLSISFDEKAVSTIVLFMVATSETFAFCKLGSQLNDESEAVADAAFLAQKYDLALSDKKALSLIIQRAQKPEGIKMVGFQYLDIQLFGSLVQRSYSILMVIRDQL